MAFKLLSILSFIFLTISCSKEEPVYQPTNKADPYVLYSEAYKAFELNDFFNAEKKFSEAEINFKNIDLAAKSAIMSCFSLYSINFYNEALQNIDRFLTTYPSDKNVIYAEYLKAVIFFEQISDEKKDIKPLLDATAQIDIFLTKYPSSDYAVDLKFKKNLIQNQLSAKELYIAKYYISVQKWVAAINRLKTIVEKYDETIFIEEALHRLVEIHYYLGLDEEAKRYAKILGYNYNSGEWYKQSYKIINNDYDYNDKINEDKKKDNDNFIKKIIKIIK
jgi:outer membrane protein assembly factor BamD